MAETVSEGRAAGAEAEAEAASAARLKAARESGLPAALWQTGLEPAYLLRLFFQYPPQNFTADYALIAADAAGIHNIPADSDGSAAAGAEEKPFLPLFFCLFNLLTALDSAQIKKLKKWPFYRLLSRLLTFKSLFAGTTLSEFLPLPHSMRRAEAEAAANMLLAQGKGRPFIIAKDLPQGVSALISAEQAAAAQAFDAALADRGFISVEGQALAYVPLDYDGIDDYFTRFSKTRRKNLRRKLRARELLTIDVLTKGAAEFYDETALEEYYRLYNQVYSQSEIHFDYLSRDFFRALLQNADDSLRFMRYFDKQGRLIGYNICFIVGDRLVDKYIGLDYPAAADYSLYFVSWFYNLEYARRLGLRYYVAGWTDPQVKAQLGAHFIMTRHRVFIRNRWLRALLRRLLPLFEGDAAILAARKPQKRAKQNGR